MLFHGRLSAAECQKITHSLSGLGLMKGFGGEDSDQAKATQVKQQLGNRQDGYFVVYAKENVKPPRHGGMYFYCFEYEVFCGANAAVTYALGLPEKYSWQLVQRFPQTPVGRDQAYDLWKKLLKEKRFGKGK